MATLLKVRSSTTTDTDQIGGSEFITGRQALGILDFLSKPLDPLSLSFGETRYPDAGTSAYSPPSPYDVPRDFSHYGPVKPAGAAVVDLGGDAAFKTATATGVFKSEAIDLHFVRDSKDLPVLCVGCATCASGGKSFNGYELNAALDTGAPVTTFSEGILTVTVGGFVSGEIETDDDVDIIEVDLVAGQTYMVALFGSGSNPVLDSFLQVFAPGGTLVNEDDDGGIDYYSIITFTAATTGTYQILASAFDNGPGFPATGEWTVTVQQQTTDSVPNTVSAAIATPVFANLGYNYGFIESGTDNDVYAVNLTAGFVYNFQVAGGADYDSNWASLPPGELDTRIRIYDSAGNLLFENDDIDFPDDISSALSFLPTTSGTYYIEIDPWAGQTGGYVLDIQELDPSSLNLLDAIDWGGAQLASNNVTVYFAAAGEVFDGQTSLGWNAYEIQQAMAALNSYSQFADLTFTQTGTAAGSTFQLVTVNSGSFLGYFNPPGTTNAGVGVFARNGFGWDENNVAGGLEAGGYGWITLIHEIGHGLGMSHPHDTGGGSPVMLGVSGPFGSYGMFDLNQGVYTTMSYNDGWQLHPNAVGGFPPGDPEGWGYQATPMALDIALIQAKYGAVAANTGDDVYVLPTVNQIGTGWVTIWDTDGVDTISHVGSASATIDLTAATLDYSPTGGGVISWVQGIFGGFTIANGVVIENASGGSGADVLLGNAVANELSGNDGNDILMGREGDDTLFGGDGSDTALYLGNMADYTITHVGGTTWTIQDNVGDEGTDTLVDVEFAQFADGIVTLNASPGGNTAPTLSGVALSQAFLENVVNATPQFIAAAAVFEDAEGNFNGGTLTVTGVLAEDVIAVNHQGTGPGQIGVSGSDITYGGTVIGSFTGGDGTDLTITLNGFATSVAVEALIQNLTYANTSHTPTQDRTLTINVTDADGADLSSSVYVPGAFVQLTGGSNPLNAFSFSDGVVAAAIDVDNDGDLDLIIGDQPGNLRYFQNDGSGNYTELTGVANPFNGLAFGSYSAPVAIDFDGDGDLDLVVGRSDGTLSALQNNGNGTFTLLAGVANPFNGIDVGSFSVAAAGDFDGDGDVDLIVGRSDGQFVFIANDGSNNFAVTGGVITGLPDIGSYSAPTAIDIDGDGDLDIVTGNLGGTLQLFLNDGSGNFTAATGVDNPFDGIGITAVSLPSFVDIDGDGDLDLVLGGYGAGGARVYENTGTFVAGSPPEIDITVTAQNDAPSGTNASTSIPQDGSYTFTSADFGYSDLEGDTFVSVIITTLPANGELLLNGVPVTAGQEIDVADIDNGDLTFEPAPGEAGNNYGNFTFQVRDDGGTADGGQDTDQSPNLFQINVQPDNTAPTLSGLAPSVTFLENTVNATPQILDADVTFSDLEDAFDGGTLTVSGLVSGEDIVGINNQGTGAGEIGMSGSDVTYGGTVIGSVAGGNGTDLVVTFNANASAAAIEALIENLTYANTSDTPTPSRTLTITVVDEGGLANTGMASFTELTGGDNPLDGLIFGAGPNVAFVDVDNDGDLDLVIGDQPGTLRFFQNDGVGNYTEVTGAGNPFDGWSVGVGSTYSSPTAIDIDGDGDLDLVIGAGGANGGMFFTWQNNGNGTWTELVGAGVNPFHGIDIGNFSDPAAGDIDGDGDIDLIAGNSAGQLFVFANNGDGTFTQLVGAANPFNGLVLGSFTSPTAGDLNGDGYADVIVGNNSGLLFTFINNGDGTFTQLTGVDNPITIDFGSFSLPTLADIDGDGDLDLAVADSVGGDFRVLQNNPLLGATIVVNVTPEDENSAPTLTDVEPEVTYLENTVNAALQHLDTDVTFSDAEDNFDGGTVTVSGLLAEDLIGIIPVGSGPGEIDVSGTDVLYEGVVIGTLAGGNGTDFTVTLNAAATSAAVEALIEALGYGNTSDDPTPSRTLTLNVTDAGGLDLTQAGGIVELTGGDNPFLSVTADASPAPTFFDVDGDGDLDLVFGDLYGNLRYFQNNGDGTFTEQTGASNPFTGLGEGVGYYTSPVGIDFDGDGDLDLVLGSNYGDLAIFENDGSGNFSLLGFSPDFGSFSDPAAIDIDNDGDLDLVVGLSTGALVTLRNDGGGAFTTLTGASNPFDGVNVGTFASPAGGDIDGDGLMDLVVGTSAGTIAVFRNNGDGSFTQLTGSDNPFDGVNVGSFSLPTLVDLDGDGILDLVVGSANGDLRVFQSVAASSGVQIIVNVTPEDDAPVAQPDAFVTDEATPVSGSVFADNGSGEDVDPDSPLVVSAVNGSAGNVGVQITLASGALLTLNADGTFVYDPNGVYDPTPTAGSGASNTPGHDSFTYTLDGGNTVTVSITLNGLDTDDLLIGTPGADVLAGGLGNDTYRVDNADDQVIELAGEGNDTVYAYVSYKLAFGTSVETLSTFNHQGTEAINLTGNNLANTLLGNNGANVLNGGAGADVMWGFDGDDIYLVDNAGDVIREAAGQGYDTAYAYVSYTLGANVSVEVLSTFNHHGTETINLTGNNLANTLFGNNAANVLNGGGGADVMWGFGGDDIYLIDDAGDVIRERADEGYDTAFTYVSYTLGAGTSVEALSTFNWLGTEAIDLTGNELANRIFGNAGDNVLNGGGGNDILTGFGGADTFAFTTAIGPGNVDRITDFETGIDKIALDDAIFTAIGGLGALDANAFVTGTAATSADHRIIYDQATGLLYYDADGNGAGAAVLFAALDGAPNLAASDFVVI